MMTNLFSSFDPISSLSIPLNWISSLLGLFIINSMFWLSLSRNNFILSTLNSNLFKEFYSLSKFNSFFIMMFISIFTFIMFNNIMGLVPYLFTSSSHLVYSISLALPLWLALMTYGWIFMTSHMFTHLLPQGTPSSLMPFMVIIESISNIIRPLTLSVRLAANMIAGHLLLTLLSDSMVYMSIGPTIMFLFLQILLLTLEMAVAFIQAYVFSMLISLYTQELSYDKT